MFSLNVGQIAMTYILDLGSFGDTMREKYSFVPVTQHKQIVRCFLVLLDH